MRARLPLLTLSLLAACSGESGSGHLNGAIVKGPVDGATVCAYTMGAAGKGDLLGCTTTKVDGSYAFDFAHEGPVIVEASGGTYTDEATGVVGVPLETPLTTAGMVGGGNQTLVATPLTSIAFHSAAAEGDLSLDKLEIKSEQVKSVFRLGAEVDLARTVPDVSVGSASPYGVALVGVSRMLRGGASLAQLSRVSRSEDVELVGGGFNACRADLPDPTVDIQVSFWPSLSAFGEPTVIEVLGPHPQWRSTLPLADTGNPAPCSIELNTNSEVRFICTQTVAVARLTVFAGGSASAQVFDAGVGPVGELTLAGDKVVFSGGTLRVTRKATISIDGGSGSVIRDPGFIYSSGPIAIKADGGVVAPCARLRPTGAAFDSRSSEPCMAPLDAIEQQPPVIAIE